MLAPRQPAVWIERWLQRSTAAREARDVLLDDATWPPNQKGRMKDLPISSFAAGMMMHPTMACPLDWTRTSGFQSGGEQGRYLCGFRARLAAAHNCTILSFGSNFEWRARLDARAMCTYSIQHSDLRSACRTFAASWPRARLSCTRWP